MTKKQKKMLKRIIIAGAMFVVLFVLSELEVFGFIPAPFGFITASVLYLADYLIIGHDILKKAFKGIKNGRVFDENFLMAVATLGAIGLAIYELSGDYAEAVAVMLFYQIGEFFQNYAVGKSRKNISALMDIRPDYANIEVEGKLTQVDPSEVKVGSIIVVQPGEKVPIDGVVTEGSGTLNTSALTGESVPREVSVGSEIISGCINLTNVLKVETTKDFGESTVSKILTLVEEATSKKSKSENFISKFARVYTPIVCISALVLAIVPPLFLLLSGAASGPQWSIWVYRALTFLVVSCPCALVISIPLTFFAGIGGASREGILVKGSSYLEQLSKTKIVAFDKTGTLTKGVFEVTHVTPVGVAENELIELAALSECASSHPISKSLKAAYGKEIDRNRVSDIEEISGHGINAKVDGKTVSCGNMKLMTKLGISCDAATEVGTIIYVAVNGKYAGYIVISDVIKETSKTAMNELKKAGVTKTVMLTGDVKAVADMTAKEIGVSEVKSELLPQDKVAAVEELLANKNSQDVLAFTGDGINDAPVLGLADIGIAMGAMGSDAAIEAADVVLMDDDPMKIAKAIKISQKCLRIVYENITFALVVKIGCLILAAVGIANMWYAIFADVGVMVLAVLNAIRALRVHNL